MYIYILQKKLPKWLGNICTTKKCVFNNFWKIIAPLYIYIYVYIHIHIYANRINFRPIYFSSYGNLKVNSENNVSTYDSTF